MFAQKSIYLSGQFDMNEISITDKYIRPTLHRCKLCKLDQG